MRLSHNLQNYTTQQDDKHENATQTLKVAAQAGLRSKCGHDTHSKRRPASATDYLALTAFTLDQAEQYVTPSVPFL